MYIYIYVYIHFLTTFVCKFVELNALCAQYKENKQVLKKKESKNIHYKNPITMRAKTFALD